jgi:hypothetical protein
MERHNNQKRISSAVIGSGTAELATLPICTLKTLYQTSSSSQKQNIRTVYATKGIRGFYSASVPAVGAQIFASTYKLVLFDVLTTRWSVMSSHPMTDFDIILCGILTSLTCILFTNPLDYFRVSLQVGKKIVFRNIYNGIIPNSGKAIIGGATFLPIRKILKNNFPKMASWKAGLLSALISTAIMHPFDYFKTFLLAQNRGSRCHANLLRNPYRGLSLNLARIVPHFIIMTEITDRLNC